MFIVRILSGIRNEITGKRKKPGTTKDTKVHEENQEFSFVYLRVLVW